METIGQKHTEFSDQSAGLVGNIMDLFMNTTADLCDHFARILLGLLSLSVTHLSLVKLVLFDES